MSNTARIAATAANTLTKPLNVEEVFSTYVYETASSVAVNNGIDLAGEGGLVWIKTRDIADNHFLNDTERGTGKALSSDLTSAESTTAYKTVSSFNSNGYTAQGHGYASSKPLVSWTFRKAPKFFDVVTYTGDGTSNRQISHDLGTTAGMCIVKRTDNSASWFVWHRSTGDNVNFELNDTTAATPLTTHLIGADSTTFTVNNNADVNANGGTFVAYLFAHNDGDGEFGPDGDADIIKCGSYTGTGSDGNSISLGFEPQWVLVKKTNEAYDWTIFDNMRGVVNGGNDQFLHPNLSDAEDSPTNAIHFDADGFTVNGGFAWTNDINDTYIYIAIRRGPMAVPESATDVFAIDTKNSSGDNTDPTWDLGIVTDMAIQKFNKTTSTTPLITSRLTGTNYLLTSETSAETSNSGMQYDYMTGVGAGNGSTTDVNDIVWGWKRAPNYFDAVAYTGDGTNGRAISHNLGVAPEMMWVRVRNAANDWVVYHKDLGEDTILRLNSSSATISKNVFSSNTPTDSVFYVQGSAGYDVNYSSSQTYIAYLFASLPGVSKVGSYTGTGAAQDIDCGFSSGARFVLIKRTDSTSSWFVFDSERGIVSGNDPYLYLNLTNAQVTSRDGVDPLSSGFSLTTDSTFNASGGSYIFYAIA